MPKCEICGEPMPEGEEMFKFHGMSGPCPKPPLSKIERRCVVEYDLQQRRDNSWWIAVTRDRSEENHLGPFETEAEARAAYDDLLKMMGSIGAADATEH